MITPLTDEALEGCVRLYVDIFTAAPWNETWTTSDATRRLRDFLDTPRSEGVCLSDPDGTLVGFALGHRERVGAEDHFLLQEMCVRTSRQRQGSGTLVLEALSSRLDGVRHWYLLTARDSDASGFYERLGFRAAGRMGVFVRP